MFWIRLWMKSIGLTIAWLLAAILLTNPSGRDEARHESVRGLQVGYGKPLQTVNLKPSGRV